MTKTIIQAKAMFRKLRKNAKAISPVLSVLMMITIAVAASLVTYAWVMGYLGFTTSKAGKAIMVQSVAYDDPTLWVYVQNVGEGAVEFDEAGFVYIDDVLQPTANVTLVGNNPLFEGETITIIVDPAGHNRSEVKVKVVTTQGTFTEASNLALGEGGGGGGVVTPPPTVTRVLATEAGFSGVLEGDLLVVIANTRTGTGYTTGALTASVADFDTLQVASFFQTTSDRRAVAIFAKTAVGGESGTVTVTWGGSDVSTYEILYQVFRMVDGTDTWTLIANGANHGTEPEVSILTVPSAALPGGSTANVLTIGAMVWRDDPGTPSFTDLDGLVEFDFNGAFSATEYNYGLPVTSTIVTWPTIQRASGLLVQISCS
jgi:FlaG/FlaF family flagellin (archaellin)